MAEPDKPVRPLGRILHIHRIEGAPLVNGRALRPFYRRLWTITQIGFIIVPLVVWAALEADYGDFPFVQQGINQHVAGLVAEEDELDVGRKRCIAPAGPVHAAVFVQALGNTLKAQKRCQGKGLVVVTVAEIGAILAGGDGGIGL